MKYFFPRFSFDFATNCYQSKYLLIHNHFLWKFAFEPWALSPTCIWLLWGGWCPCPAATSPGPLPGSPSTIAGWTDRSYLHPRLDITVGASSQCNWDELMLFTCELMLLKCELMLLKPKINTKKSANIVLEIDNLK